VGHCNSFGIATRYGLDESKSVQTGPGAHPASCTMVVFPGVKAAGAWHWPPTPSSSEVKESVELCTYLLPLWSFVGCSGVNFYTECFSEWMCRPDCCQTCIGRDVFLCFSISVSCESANSLGSSLITWYSSILLKHIPQLTRKNVPCFSNSSIWTLWS